jgi:hypothetical protein
LTIRPVRKGARKAEDVRGALTYFLTNFTGDVVGEVKDSPCPN